MIEETDMIAKLKALTMKQRTILLLLLAAAGALAYCAPPGTFRDIDFEMTGTVRDSETREPIEGAFVVANYYTIRSGMAGNAKWCFKSRGMYTGKDGTYHFPVEKLDLFRPDYPFAIKVGYVKGERLLPSQEAIDERLRRAYTGVDLLLTRQDAAEKFGYTGSDSSAVCNEAETRPAAAASIEYLRIKIAGMERNGAKFDRIEGTIKEQLMWLERLPEQASSKLGEQR